MRTLSILVRKIGGLIKKIIINGLNLNTPVLNNVDCTAQQYFKQESTKIKYYLVTNQKIRISSNANHPKLSSN